ncbi:Cyclin-dependent kinases regulatory subunit 2, partial [Linum perenne]
GRGARIKDSLTLHSSRSPLRSAEFLEESLLVGGRRLIQMGQIQYSEKYFDDTYEYRHVVLTPEVAKLLPKNRLLSENEWRAIGVQQSRGWVHYAIHRPEPHIMLFRRPLNYQQQQEAAAQAQQQTMVA